MDLLKYRATKPIKYQIFLEELEEISNGN